MTPRTFNCCGLSPLLPYAQLSSKLRRFKAVHGLALLALTAFVLSFAGCKATTAAEAAAQSRLQEQEQARQQAHATAQLREVARQQMEQVPPPSKSLYLAVHNRDAWGNPFLIVGRDMVNLRVVYPDANTSELGMGGMLRPASARRQELDLRLADLPAALTALPANAWPYGRVVALEEGGTAAKADRPQVRRNIEAAIQTLNDLGIVVDEWSDNSGSILR